jgi:hypothetical protein
MGMRIMSVSSCEKVKPEEETKPNPNPYRFEIIDKRDMLPYVVLMVNYKDCTTYGGNKVLVYECTDINVFNNITYLDPHFVDGDDSNQYPIARFTGNEEGFYNACIFCSQKRLR